VAVGYFACKLMGHSDQHCLAVAGGVGATAAVACGIHADRLAKRKKELAGRENDLDARLRYAKGLNEDAQTLNAELRARVADASKRSNQLAVQVKQNQASATALASERKRLDDELKAARDQVSLQRDAAQEVKAFRASQQTASPDLDAEIAKQERLLAEAQKQVDALASLRERAAGAA
jgi:chromosome segregation ATPase